MNRAATASDRPLVWCLEGHKAGDNSQLRAIAAALAEKRAFDLRTIQLDFAPQELMVTLLLDASTLGLTSEARARIVRPWPDVILTAGRRNEAVARWVRRESLGHTRLVHCGRPWAHPLRYDLIVTTPQYFLDRETYPNVLTLPLPPAPSRSAAPVAVEGPVLLLIGGESGSTQLSAAFAKDLVARVAAFARNRNRPLRIATSRRTSTDAESAIGEQARQEQAEVYLWNAQRGEGNPYAEWLDHASGVVVTADSMSMVAESAALGHPTWIARLPAPDRPWWQTRRGWRWRSATHEIAQIVAPLRFRRDTSRLLGALVESGRAAWFEPEGSEARTPRAVANGQIVEGDAERAAAAVADLLPRLRASGG